MLPRGCGEGAAGPSYAARAGDTPPRSSFLTDRSLWLRPVAVGRALPEKPHSAFGQETLNANGSNGTKADQTPVSILCAECVGSLHKPLGNMINPRK